MRTRATESEMETPEPRQRGASSSSASEELDRDDRSHAELTASTGCQEAEHAPASG